MLLLVLVMLFVLAFTTSPGYCKGKAMDSITQYFGLDKTTRIIVLLAPKADFKAADVKKKVFTDKEEIKQFTDFLSKVPVKGPGVKMKVRADAEEYRIKFYDGKKLLATLRTKANKLDAPYDKGWDFYMNKDTMFMKLVRAALR